MTAEQRATRGRRLLLVAFIVPCVLGYAVIWTNAGDGDLSDRLLVLVNLGVVWTAAVGAVVGAVAFATGLVRPRR